MDSNLNANSRSKLLEYIRGALPDRLELQQTVRQTLVRRNLSVRYASFTATYNALSHFSSIGGCKVLQFVGFCCNPSRDQQNYPELCASLYPRQDDADYILLETEVCAESDDDSICCFGKGVWFKVSEVYKYLNAESTQIDCVVAMSPQHERLTQIFEELGYKYIIGVEAPSNEHPFSTTETAAFLEQFYGAILDQRSVTNAYDLSLQNALSTRGSVRGGNDNDPKYILQINQLHRNERFIIFDDNQLKIGEIKDKSQHEKLPKTNLRDPIRPFFGRSEYIITLLKKLMDTQIVNVTGKELIGKSSVVKTTTRYLLQMGFFRGGCFVIDCKLQSAKYAKSSPNKSFNECVYDVLKSCGVNFKSQPNDDDDDGVDIPLMNSSPNSLLSIPSVPTHISRRSSARFPKMDEFRQQIKDEPIINKTEFGDPKTSPRSLFKYLETSIYFDQKPPSHEPFCFVILNMDHWLHGADKVSEWITKFSKELFKKEDSRIICTGGGSLDISAVSTLNMKNLAPFDSVQLATLFKHFCRGISSKFDPSISDISEHKELQIIFDGRPGRAKKVSQYVRYLFAENAMNEDDIHNNNNKNNKNNQISLDYIAKQFPKSKYAFNPIGKYKYANAISSNYNFNRFKQMSTSLPSRFHNMDDSSIRLDTDGSILLSDHPSTSTSKLIDYQTDPYYQNDSNDPAVLIPDLIDDQSEIVIMPSSSNSQSQTGTPSPSNIDVTYSHAAVPMIVPIQPTQSAPLSDTNSYSLQYANKNRMGPYQYNNNNNNNVSFELQYYNDSIQNQNDIPPPPPPQFEHSHSMEATSSTKLSLTPIQNSFDFNMSRKSTPLSPTTSQNYKKANKKPKRNKGFNQSIETLKANIEKSKHPKSGPSQEVTALFLPHGTSHTSLPATDLQTGFSHDSPRKSTMIKSTGSLTRIRVTDENKHVSQVSVLTNNTNDTNESSPSQMFHASHRMRAVNQSIEHKNHRTSTLDSQQLLNPFHQGMLSQPVSPMEMDISIPMHSNPVSPELSPDVSQNDMPLDDLTLTKSNQQQQQKNESATTKYAMLHTLDEVDELDDDDEDCKYIPTTRMGSVPSSQRHSSVAHSERMSSTSSASFTPSVENSDEFKIESKISADAKHKINELPNQRISALTSNKANVPSMNGHSMQFSVSSAISVINEDKAITVCTPQNPNSSMLDEVVSIQQNHQKNASMLMSPRLSVTDEIPNVSMDLSLKEHGGAASAPPVLIGDTNSLRSNSDNIYTKMTMTDDAIIGIQGYSARKIWIDSCLANNNNLARLQDLYPHLIKEFTRLTRCNERQPTMMQIELFFVRTGGDYDKNQPLPYIRADKFDSFFSWFRCMCQIIKDLRPMYNQKHLNPLIGLFYGRTAAQENLENKPEGTFLLRLATLTNMLCITYKNQYGTVKNLVLSRVGNELYNVKKSQKETNLFGLIRSWTQLRYLYTPNKLIRKKYVF